MSHFQLILPILIYNKNDSSHGQDTNNIPHSEPKYSAFEYFSPYVDIFAYWICSNREDKIWSNFFL